MTSQPPPTPSSPAASLPKPADAACRCVVARGRSPRVEMTFEGDTTVTCRVGASRDSDWWLTGRGVPDNALDLHWDGELLWVADRAGHGRATVDGEPLGSRWRGLGGGCRLEFPGGALVVDCSRPGVVVETVPKQAPSAPPPVRSDVREVLRPPPMLDAPTRVKPLSAMMPDEPTRAWRAEARTLPGPGPNPNRPRTIVPPPAPAALDELQEPTREILKSGPAPRSPEVAADAPGVDNANGQTRNRRASTGG